MSAVAESVPASTVAGLRFDRDRYVGYAFAAADVLLELDDQGRITTGSGAAQGILGRGITALSGVEFVSTIAGPDRAMVARLVAELRQTGRLDTMTAQVERPDGSRTVVLIGGCHLPTCPGKIFITLGLLPHKLAQAANEGTRDPVSGLLGQQDLLDMVAKAPATVGPAAPRRLTLLHLEGLSQSLAHLPPDRATRLTEEIGALLRARSAGGDSAGKFGDDVFGVVSAKPGGPDEHERLEREVGSVVRWAGLPEGAIKARVSTVDIAPPAGGQPGDAARAIAYAVKMFAESNGGGFTLAALSEGLGNAVKNAVGRMGNLRRIIEEGDFTLAYQPIVTLADKRVHHYEALARFPEGLSPSEVVAFGEQIGLIEEFDLAVCRKAIADLDNNPTASCAINISGRSVQSDTFRARLAEQLKGRRTLRDRLMFELTESAAVDRFDQAASLLGWLKSEGFRVCLDDFGAGASAYNYLRHFEVDYVKIDGPFLKAAIAQSRDRALVRSIIRLCQDLQCSVIGEMIEDERALGVVNSLGIRYGQGWLFGKPMPALPNGNATAERVPVLKRKGVTESWG